MTEVEEVKKSKNYMITMLLLTQKEKILYTFYLKNCATNGLDPDPDLDADLDSEREQKLF